MSDTPDGLDSLGSSAAAQPVKKREIFGWCCFDFANSAFTTIVITVVGLPYFTAVVAGNDPRAAGWWGTTLALSQFCVLLLAPLVGVVADVHARKKHYLLVTALICSVATALIFGVGAGQVWLVLGLVLIWVLVTLCHCHGGYPRSLCFIWPGRVAGSYPLYS